MKEPQEKLNTERSIISIVCGRIITPASFGSQYKTLPVSLQTELIQAMGLQPYAVSQVVNAVRKAQQEATQIVQKLLEDGGRNTKEMIEAILFGDAVGKNTDSLCVMRAAGMNCKVPERLGCMGCTYEIKTKSLLSYFASEYLYIQADLQKSQIAASRIETMRRKSVVENELIPAMYEICAHLAQRTDSDELDEYQILMRGVFDDGNANAC